MIGQFIPSPEQFALWFPLSLLYAATCAWIAGYLHTNSGWHYAYTRKVFHLLIFTVAGVLHITSGLPVVVVFGMGVVLVVFRALYYDRSAFFNAIARVADFPYKKLFIIIPMATTALGGILSNYFFAEWAVIGYWVTGCGDAVGEPAGRYYGRNFYSVPTLTGTRAVRSLEGSMAVFAVSLLIAWIGLGLLGSHWPGIWMHAFACALVAAVTEAISHHGLDNLTIQVGVSGAAYWLAA